MKKIFITLALFALVVCAIPRASRADVSVDFFYDNMSGGSWVEVEDYGYGWQPAVAVSDTDWRPYADGYWAYTDYGWTWVSYEDFGWATYHYGRWSRVEDMGWVWFPGSDLEWGPAWVSWRYGENACGWAPLPPRGGGVVYEGQPIGGHVDIEFDIGPSYYNFVDVRYIGEPVLRSHLYAPSYNVTYINQTVNVTNITVKNKVVYNYGPDVNVLSQRSARPIQRLKIERQTNVDVTAAARGGGLTKVQGDKLIVAGPQTIQRSARQVAPPGVRTKVAKNKIERGWKGVADENARTQLKQKMQSEDPKKIPPPVAGTAAQQSGGAPQTAQDGVGNAPGAPNASGPAPVNAPGNEKGRHAHPGEKGQPAPGAAPTGSNMERPMNPEGGKHKGKQDGQSTQPAPPAGTTIEGAEATPFEGKIKGKRGRPMPSNVDPSAGAPTGESENVPPMEKQQKAHRIETGQMPGAMNPSEEGAAGERKMGKPKAHRLEPGQVPPGASGPAGGGPPPGSGMNQHKGQPNLAPQQGGQPPAVQPGQSQGQGKGEHPKKKKGENESPAPNP